MPHLSLKYFKPCVLFHKGHQGHFTSFRPFTRRWFPRLLHLRIVSSWEVQWQSLEDVDLWKVSHLAKGEVVDHPLSVRVFLTFFLNINKNRGRMNNDEIPDVLRWRKLMNTVSLGKVFHKSECYVNQKLLKCLHWKVSTKHGSPFAGSFDVTHHILSNHQPIWPDFVVVVVQGLTKIIGTTIPERFPILYSSVLWESILGCHPRGQKWKSNVWSLKWNYTST